jgi:hypothetical protein
VDTPEIPAGDSKQDNEQEAEQEWIAKYRHALESVPTVQRTQSAEIRDSLIFAWRFVASGFGGMWDRWLRPRGSESAAAPKRASASAQSFSPEIGVGMTAQTPAELTRRAS